MHPKQLTIKDFTYELPEEKIARHPLAKRDESKLLVYKNGIITESQYSALYELLAPGTLLVFNNTKVVEARLLFKKPTGGGVELFCLEPAGQYPDIATAMQQKGRVLWKCLAGGAKKWKNEPLQKQAVLNGKTIHLTAHKVERRDDYFLIEFVWDDGTLAFADILHAAGVVPLPPYLNRAADEADKTAYQTVYARHDGSVAAPTAGLHFTHQLLQKLAAKNVQASFVTLHVGAGTFKPVKADTMAAHDMHSEFFEVGRQFVEQLLNTERGNVTAVGTTSLRTIESLYWMGAKAAILHGGQKPFGEIFEDDLAVKQWAPYDDLPQHITQNEALGSLLAWMDATKRETLICKTQIIIAPGYTLRVAGGLVTNFHQPQSTLLLLVAAVIGNDWRRVYQYALQNNFRFLSYGDGSLLYANNGQ